MFKLYFLIFTIFATILTTNGDDEALVESIGEEFSTENSNARNGKLLWSGFTHPAINMFMNVAETFYGGQGSGKIFDFLRDSYELPGGLSEPYSEYDFIIIGAGSAGCALAERLSKNRNTTVLLMDVGKPEMLFTDIPAMSPYFQSTDYSWDYYMEHQPGVCKGMTNERCYWPRGKAVGGTSVINYMIYTRGRPKDWDRIAADGNYGWSYDDVIKYYVQLEKAYLDGLEKQPHRGTEGDMPVEFVPFKTKLLKTFLEAGTLLGHPTVDYNAPEELGFGPVQVTITRGHRQSAAKVFLHPHKNRRNLHILPETRATKILIDPDTKTAYGVEYVRNKMIHTVHARKEVILSAGPIASPQLLMLSGVGPKDHLNDKGISVIQDLPVGRVLYDHICFPGLVFALNTTDVAFIENKGLTLSEVLEWLRNGDNIFASPGGVEAIGYIKTHVSDDPDPTVPDIELIDIGGSFLSDGGLGGSKAIRRGMRISEALIDEAFGSIDGKDTWSAIPMLLHPKSVGRLELKDSNPFSNPKMIGNYFTVHKDVETFVAAIRHIQRLVQTPPFQQFGAKLYNGHLRTCREFEFDTDEYWECALRTLTATLHHQIATCRMGPENDSLAVLNPELQVRGIKNLRVVDTSIIPRTISAHTNAPGMMIGLKGADIIKHFWNIS